MKTFKFKIMTILESMTISLLALAASVVTLVPSIYFHFWLKQRQKIRIIDAFSILEREKEYILKHHVIVKAIMQSIPKPKKTLHLLDLKKIQTQLSKHQYRSYTLIRNINNIIMNVGYDYFDRNGKLIESRFNHLRNEYKDSLNTRKQIHM